MTKVVRLIVPERWNVVLFHVPERRRFVLLQVVSAEPDQALVCHVLARNGETPAKKLILIFWNI